MPRVGQPRCHVAWYMRDVPADPAIGRAAGQIQIAQLMTQQGEVLAVVSVAQHRADFGFSHLPIFRQI